MICTPAHKQTDPKKKPGQIKFSLGDGKPWDGVYRTIQASEKEIAQSLIPIAKTLLKKKLTFDEWSKVNRDTWPWSAEFIWQQAQENK